MNIVSMVLCTRGGSHDLVNVIQRMIMEESPEKPVFRASLLVRPDLDSPSSREVVPPRNLQIAKESNWLVRW